MCHFSSSCQDQTMQDTQYTTSGCSNSMKEGTSFDLQDPWTGALQRRHRCCMASSSIPNASSGLLLIFEYLICIAESLLLSNRMRQQCRNVTARTTVYQYSVHVHKKESRISEHFKNQFLDNL